FFYLFFSTVKFPIVQVSPQNNEFEFGKEAQYVIKWLQEFFNGNLKDAIHISLCVFSRCSEEKQQDINPDTMPDLEKATMKQHMERHFGKIAKLKPIHQCFFLKYLYQQLRPLTQPKLKKKFLEIAAKSIKWRHKITKSVIEMGKISCFPQYNCIKLNAEEKEQKIESSGQEKFYLCEKWCKCEKCSYLVNQDGVFLNVNCCFFIEGISILINDKKNPNKKQLDEFQKSNFDLFDWQQDLKERELALTVLNFFWFYFELKTEETELRTEKEKRLRLLFRILGIT
ncbi:hypothetical protein RFI_04020, partial [Reticulomyxa filosa]